MKSTWPHHIDNADISYYSILSFFRLRSLFGDILYICPLTYLAKSKEGGTFYGKMLLSTYALLNQSGICHSGIVASFLWNSKGLEGGTISQKILSGVLNKSSALQ